MFFLPPLGIINVALFLTVSYAAGFTNTAALKNIYAECDLDNPSLTDVELVNFMIKHPILIERPIILANGKAAIGRPPEQVLEILST